MTEQFLALPDHAWPFELQAYGRKKETRFLSRQRGKNVMEDSKEAEIQSSLSRIPGHFHFTWALRGPLLPIHFGRGRLLKQPVAISDRHSHAPVVHESNRQRS